MRAESGKGLLFGLLIPDLGKTEIFDPICHGISGAPETADHALLWGHKDFRETSRDEQCWKLCQQFIARRVSGVFFAPLEFELKAEKVNRRIVSALREAAIPVVMLDRRTSATPESGRADLAGLNNCQAGFSATKHLIGLGCKRIGFLAYQGAASTISGRVGGYDEGPRIYGLAEVVNSTLDITHDDQIDVNNQWEVEAFVCVNDHVAGVFMHAFLAQGVHTGRYAARRDRRCFLCQSLAHSSHDRSATLPRDWGSGHAHDARALESPQHSFARGAIGRTFGDSEILWQWARKALD